MRDHDPEVALYGGGPDGLAVPRAVLRQAERLLRAGGLLVMEHADVQAEPVLAALDRRIWEQAADHRDLAGRPRYVTAVRRPRLGSRACSPPARSSPSSRPSTWSARHAFYGGTLGLEVLERTPYAVVLDAAGTTLRLTLVEELTPHPFTILGWLVEDLDAVVAGLQLAGVQPLRYEGMDQDERGVWTTPAGARVVWFRDPDGNTLSLTEA